TTMLVQVAHREQTGGALPRQRSLGKGSSSEELEQAEKNGRVHEAQYAQTQAQKQAREALGTLEAEAELARRAKELADARSALTLLEAGSRPEEVEEQRARLARLGEEARYLESLQERLRVCSPLPGVVVTPRLREKVGQYVREGELICVVEEPACLEAEIALPEQEVARILPGQEVTLKARALPFVALRGGADRPAPAAAGAEAPPLAPHPVGGELAGTVTVYCRLGEPAPGLRPGMTGYARVSCGRRPVGEILGERVLRFVRAE